MFPYSDTAALPCGCRRDDQCSPVVTLTPCRVAADEMLMESMEMVVEDGGEEPGDEDAGVLHLSPDGPAPLAALQTPQRPALLAGTEVGRLPPAEPMDQAAGSSHGGPPTAAGHQGQYAGPLALVALNKELVPHPQQPG